MMCTESPVKMSARRSLANILGEPDHQQNKVDLQYWNNYFDNQFASRWGFDPKSGVLDSTKWERLTPERVPPAYGMPDLEWACNPKKRCRRSTHLGLQGSATRTVSEKPLGDQATVTASDATTVRPLTPSNLDNLDTPTEMVRSQCSSPVPTTPEAPSSPSPSSASPKISSVSSSRKRKQTTINEYFQQRKKSRVVPAKRRIILS